MSKRQATILRRLRSHPLSLTPDTPRQIVDVRGKLVDVPRCLRCVWPELAERARIARQEQESERKTGKALAPVLDVLKRGKDKGALLDAGNFLAQHVGTFSARFFYEEAARQGRA